jgi:ankyrin repeat protein
MKQDKDINENDLEIVKLLLDHKADLYWPDKKKNTPLDLALRCRGENKDNLLALLKKAGLDFDKDESCSLLSKAGTPLAIAIKDGYEEGVRSLLKHQASVNRTAYGRTPLQIAAQCQNVQLATILLDAKAAVDYVEDHFPEWPSETAPTPLHIAVEKGQREMVNLLLERKANPNAFDKRTTPIFLAACSNSTSLVSCLLQNGANPFMGNNSERETPLHLDQKEVVETIKQSPIFSENTKKLISAGFFSSGESSENIIPIADTPFTACMKEGKFYKLNRGKKGARVYWLENHHRCMQDFSKTLMDRIDEFWDLPKLVEIEEPAEIVTDDLSHPSRKKICGPT